MSLATVECNEAYDELALDAEPRFGPDTPTEDFICWSLSRFRGWRKVLTTSFGMEGCALIDMYARRGLEMEITYLDTGFFFPETYELIERMKERYPSLDFVDRGTTLSPEQQAQTYGERLWRSNPDLCCELRKVQPLKEVMARADIWISGLRRSQSATRAGVELVEWDPRFEVLKLNPLAYWERNEVWRYVRDHDVPYNELHEQGYPTLGCTHCTRAVPGLSPSEYTRLGRWAGGKKTECGLHLTR